MRGTATTTCASIDTTIFLLAKTPKTIEGNAEVGLNRLS
jgi:hypothetical protein